MKKLLVLLAVVLCSATAFSQKPKDGVLVADETYFVKSGKTGFRIVTSNDSISYKLIAQFANTGKAHKITHDVREDRFGKYWSRSFYFKNDYYDEVVIFVNTLNKKK